MAKGGRGEGRGCGGWGKDGDVDQHMQRGANASVWSQSPECFLFDGGCALLGLSFAMSLAGQVSAAHVRLTVGACAPNRRRRCAQPWEFQKAVLNAMASTQEVNRLTAAARKQRDELDRLRSRLQVCYSLRVCMYMCVYV